MPMGEEKLAHRLVAHLHRNRQAFINGEGRFAEGRLQIFINFSGTLPDVIMVTKDPCVTAVLMKLNL